MYKAKSDTLILKSVTKLTKILNYLNLYHLTLDGLHAYVKSLTKKEHKI